jgi:hypothetical protein
VGTRSGLDAQLYLNYKIYIFYYGDIGGKVRNKERKKEDQDIDGWIIIKW